MQNINTTHIDLLHLLCFSGFTRMELLLDNATFQIYILHTSGHIQVIESTLSYTAGYKMVTNFHHNVFFLKIIIIQGLPCGSSGQILVVAWQTLSEMSCLSFKVLRRSTVGHTLCFTREHTARWVEFEDMFFVFFFLNSVIQSPDETTILRISSFTSWWISVWNMKEAVHSAGIFNMNVVMRACRNKF